MGGGKKVQRILNVKEAADLLRGIADSLEGESGAIGDVPLPDVADLRKLSISIKKDRDAENVSLKFKFKEFDRLIGQAPSAGGEVGTPKKPGYKSLKKEMKTSFKELSRSLSQGVLPGAAVVELFVRQGIQMCEYPGKGDEHYEEFRLRCQELKEAFDSGDVAGCQAAYRELQRMKIECHSDHR